MSIQYIYIKDICSKYPTVKISIPSTVHDAIDQIRKVCPSVSTIYDVDSNLMLSPLLELNINTNGNYMYIKRDDPPIHICMNPELLESYRLGYNTAKRRYGPKGDELFLGCILS